MNKLSLIAKAQKSNFPKGSRWGSFTPKNELKELYKLGMSTREIAKATGWSSAYIWRICKDITRDRVEGVILSAPMQDSTHWRTCRWQARRIYEKEVGPIPDGFHIHHIDGDWTNNSLSNLECISSSNHGKLHHPKNPIPRHLRPERREYMKKYLREYRKTYVKKT